MVSEGKEEERGDGLEKRKDRGKGGGATRHGPPKIPKLILSALLCALSPEQLPECFINIECLPLSTDVDTRIYIHAALT